MNNEKLKEANRLVWTISHLKQQLSALESRTDGFIPCPFGGRGAETPATTTRVKRILHADLRGQLREAQRQFDRL
jgi:hypothetical protein